MLKLTKFSRRYLVRSGLIGLVATWPAYALAKHAAIPVGATLPLSLHVFMGYLFYQYLRALDDSLSYLPATQPFWVQQNAGMTQVTRMLFAMGIFWGVAAAEACQTPNPGLGVLIHALWPGVICVAIQALMKKAADRGEFTGLHVLTWTGRYMLLPLLIISPAPFLFWLWGTFFVHTMLTADVRQALLDSPGSTLPLYD